MILFNRLNNNLQDKVNHKIKNNIKIYVKNNILLELINYRKKYFRSYILNKTRYFKIDLYYYLNRSDTVDNWIPHSIKQKFIDFLSLYLKTFDCRVDIKKIYNESYNSLDKNTFYLILYHKLSNSIDTKLFISNCIDILSIYDLEMYYIYLISYEVYYNYNKVNQLPIKIYQDLFDYGSIICYYGIKSNFKNHIKF